MAEIDFGRYAGQLRPLTYRDFVTEMEVETELERDLERAVAKTCQCYYCRYLKPKEKPA